MSATLVSLFGLTGYGGLAEFTQEAEVRAGMIIKVMLEMESGHVSKLESAR